MSTNERIYLGKLKNDAGTFGAGEPIYLSKHSWDCGWYWGFGYLGNRNLHFHFDSLLDNSKYASDLFEDPKVSNNDWWVIRDLFVQAYALKKAAEVYYYGGHQTSRKGVTDLIKDDTMVRRLNADLEKVLDTAWDFIQTAISQYKAHQQQEKLP